MILNVSLQCESLCSSNKDNPDSNLVRFNLSVHAVTQLDLRG